MINIILIIVAGLFCTWLLARLFPKAQFNATIILPLFFLPACQMVTRLRNLPSFLPYLCFSFCILILVVAFRTALQNKNISLGRTILKLLDFLSLTSVFSFLGLVVISFM
jgi:hypothetical protein